MWQKFLIIFLTTLSLGAGGTYIYIMINYSPIVVELIEIPRLNSSISYIQHCLIITKRKKIIKKPDERIVHSDGSITKIIRGSPCDQIIEISPEGIVISKGWGLHQTPKSGEHASRTFLSLFLKNHGLTFFRFDQFPFRSDIIVPGWFPVILFAGYPLFIMVRSTSSRYYRRKHNRCLHCGYNLTGNTSGTCPECGNSFR